MSDDVSVEIRSVLTDVLDKGPEAIEASWAACAEAGLLGLAVPESHGGEGLGVAEVSVLARDTGEEIGRLEPVSGGSLFVGKVSRAVPYRLRIDWPGSVQETEDPYSFGLLLGALMGAVTASGAADGAERLR